MKKISYVQTLLNTPVPNFGLMVDLFDINPQISNSLRKWSSQVWCDECTRPVLTQVSDGIVIVAYASTLAEIMSKYFGLVHTLLMDGCSASLDPTDYPDIRDFCATHGIRVPKPRAAISTGTVHEAIVYRGVSRTFPIRDMVHVSLYDTNIQDDYAVVFSNRSNGLGIGDKCFIINDSEIPTWRPLI